VESGGADGTLTAIKDSLGVLADHDIKVFFGVEGKHDISFISRLLTKGDFGEFRWVTHKRDYRHFAGLRARRIALGPLEKVCQQPVRQISSILAAVEADIPDLAAAERAGTLMFVPLAGNNMELWVTRLAGLDRPEFYLTDRDQPPPAQPKYNQQMAEWADRGCIAWATSKRELENYLHPAVLTAEEPGYTGTGADDFESVPLLFAEAAHSADPAAQPWGALDEEQKKAKASRAKKRLNTTCVQKMTPALLTQSDPNDDIRSWLRAIGQRLNA
jgi:hypothetical protein